MAINSKNTKFIEQFQKLIEQIKYDIDHISKSKSSKSESMANHFRLRQMINVVNIIKKYPHEIKSGDQLKDIKGIGKGTISRIDEIIKKGYLSEININKREQKYLKQIDELTQIFGIGRNTAYDLIVTHNIKSIKELKKAYNKGTIELSHHIILGLKYHNVYKQLIPRSEVDSINDYLKQIVQSIDSNLFHVICGSYRRGKDTSNDIDILLVHKNIPSNLKLLQHKNYLKLVIDKLKKDGFILDDIDKNYEVKYMGFCKFNNKPVRRIDIMYTPCDSFYTALLHFTGSGEFNRKIREVAIELGYTLSQLGLYVVKNGKKVKKIKINSEQDIFNKLGLEYIPPEQRSI